MVWRIPSAEKIIYLTFDDGPVPGSTEFVLDVLKSFNAKATFFCIGDNIRKHPEVFQKVMEAGHAIGNHTFNHLKGWSTPLDKYVENVNQFNEQLSSINCQWPTLFRPPYGRITRAQISALKNYKIVMWDVLTYDYQRTGSKEACLTGSIAATRPGSIVVFHDSIKAQKKMQYVLPKHLEHFSKDGYEFHSLTNHA